MVVVNANRGGWWQYDSATGVVLMGMAKGHYTFFSHLKRPVIALGYIAGIRMHM